MGTPGGTAEAAHKKAFWLEIVTIVVSAAAIVASVVTVTVGINASTAVAEFQEGAETDRSRAEFLRAQRQTAYASLVAEDFVLQSVLSQAANRPPGIDDGWNKLFDDAWRSFQLAASSVQIIGSENAARPVYHLLDMYAALQQRLKIAVTLGTDGEPVTSEEFMKLQSLRTEFIEAAKADLQGG